MIMNKIIIDITAERIPRDFLNDIVQQARKVLSMSSSSY